MYATLWVGFYDVVDGKLTLGRMVAFQSYVFQMGISLATLSGHFIALMTAKGAAARVFELLDRESEIQLDAGKTPEGKMKGDIVFENVEFRYPTRLETAVLKGFNLTVKENETVAIVGSSGAGKSTIIGLLQRFYDVSGGAVKFDGIDARDLHQGWIRRNLGLVGQEPTLFGLSIRDNLTYGIEDPSKITDEQVVEACKQANCHNFITQFPEGYKTMIGERGVRLSGGQKQRIAIARALIPSPSVLLLDEATSALDAESEHLVQTAIDEVMVGRTVVVIAHRLSTVRKADKIVVMDQGKVEAEGTHDELMKGCQIYKDLVSRQLSAK
jgi:ATP-binding cassette subfamily B protein